MGYLMEFSALFFSYCFISRFLDEGYTLLHIIERFPSATLAINIATQADSSSFSRRLRLKVSVTEL